jgi:hypothetical protein
LAHPLHLAVVHHSASFLVASLDQHPEQIIAFGLRPAALDDIVDKGIECMDCPLVGAIGLGGDEKRQIHR